MLQVFYYLLDVSIDIGQFVVYVPSLVFDHTLSLVNHFVLLANFFAHIFFQFHYLRVVLLKLRSLNVLLFTHFLRLIFKAMQRLSKHTSCKDESWHDFFAEPVPVSRYNCFDLLYGLQSHKIT